jgi:hypothetical protein
VENDNQAQQRSAEQKNLSRVLNLLENVGQYNILEIAGPTSFLLQLGTSRIILDVSEYNQAILSLTTQEMQVLTEHVELAEFIEGHWKEMFFIGSVKHWLDHAPYASVRVVVIGFVPASAMMHSGGLAQRGASRVAEPAWLEPVDAWFLPYLEADSSRRSELVVRNPRGQLAIVGTIQAQASFYSKS